MGSVSRPLLALLVAVVAFLGVWLVALRPSSSSSGSSGNSASAAASGPTLPGMKGLESAISKAHAAVATSSVASVAHGGTIVTTPSSTAAPRAASGAGAPSGASTAAGANAASGASVQPTAVSGAARRFGVVAAALDARKVVALLFYNPLGSDDRAVKRELALVPRHGGRVVRYTTDFEISQRVDDALALT